MNNLINYGQHFLIDEIEKKRFLQLMSLNDKNVIEVGAGNGTITREIVKVAKFLRSYEIDKSLHENLDKLETLNKNLEIIYEDFLKATVKDCQVLVSSLPYQILEPFLKKISTLNVERIWLITGVKYAHSLLPTMFEQQIKYTSMITKCFFITNFHGDISPTSFFPIPNTVSSIIELTPCNKLSLVNKQELFIMREIFEQKDKKIKNALVEAIIRLYKHKNQVVTKKISKNIIQNLNINSTILDNFIDLLTNDELKILYNTLQKDLVIS